ncbi:hypothetical protein ACDW_40830 [Acidovorax sp. DW039]|uniref:hypothetical protein n=1 Tax=Acidovorax sp. DW039 TaxID=3095606 RepID=UPI003093433F|nr:hypothetical protein ACDW_40830 [Acidovorax sp. DW039]
MSSPSALSTLSTSSLVGRLAANVATVAQASNQTVLALLSVTARAWALPTSQLSVSALAK